MFENLTYSYQPEQTVQCYHTGGATEHCPGPLVARYPAGSRVRKQAYVGSVRGKKEKKVFHEFDRWRYEVSGQTKLHHCNLNMNGGLGPYIDGGEQWIYLLSKHGAVSPILDFSPDSLRITEEDEQYRKYIIQKTFAKANEARFGVTVQLAELAESLEYLNGIFGTIGKLFFKHGTLSDWKSNKRFLAGMKDLWERVKHPESTWLEYRYAIMPMILSAQDLLESLKPVSPVTRWEGYKKYPDKSVTDHWFNYAAGNLCFTVEKTQTIKTGVGLNVKSQMDPAPWGTGAYDFALAAWEKTTLSFVLDWFFDVGQWLESFRNTDLVLDQRFSTLVKETELKLWLNVGKSNTGPVYECPTEGNPFRVSALHITRIIGEDVKLPTLPMFTPGSLSVLRKLDALALIIGALQSLRKR